MNESEKAVFEFIRAEIKKAGTDEFVYIRSQKIIEAAGIGRNTFRKVVKNLKRNGTLIVDDYFLSFGYKLPKEKNNE